MGTEFSDAPEQRRALVDHERHGLWNVDAQFFARAVQTALPGLDAEGKS